MPEMRGKRSSQKSAKGSCEEGTDERERVERKKRGEERREKWGGVESGRAGMPRAFLFFLVSIFGLTFGGMLLYRMNDELDSYMKETLIWELFLI